MKYDRSHTEAFYDAYGEREWERFERNAAGRVNFETHRYYLSQYIRAGDRVLDIGSGPGRFTIELAKLGAKIIVGDLSRVQLELNKQKVTDAGVESSVLSRVHCDIVDLSEIEDNSLNAVVALGGPVSYALDRAEDAIRECLRVTKPGGIVMLSVMSRLGALRHFLPAILSLVDQYGFEAISQPWKSGLLDDRFSRTGHRCRLFFAAELQKLLSRQNCKTLMLTSTNFLASESDQSLADRWLDPNFWPAFLEIEREASRQSGALDGGTHILAVLTKL